MKPVTNVRKGTHWRLLGLLGAALSIPLVAVGFSLRPGLEWAAMDSERAKLRSEVATLPADGDLEVLAIERELLAQRWDAVDHVMNALDELLPKGCDLIELFDDVRLAARAAGVQLQAMSPGTTLPLSANLLNGTSIPEHAPCATELSLLGACEPTQLADFVRRLRGGAHPAEVRALNLSRVSDSSTRFQFQLTLGMLHRGGATSGRGEQL